MSTKDKVITIEQSLFPFDISGKLIQVVIDNLKRKEFSGILKFVDHGNAHKCEFCDTDLCWGHLHSMYHFKNGKLHKDSGPAALIFVNGVKNPIQELYYCNGLIERQDGPAEIWYDNWHHNRSGERTMEIFYSNNTPYKLKCHDFHTARQVVKQFRKKLKVEIRNPL